MDKVTIPSSPGERNSLPAFPKPASRPAILSPQFDSIEQHLGELVGLRRWVNWRLVRTQDRWSKPPCTPAGRSASVEDPGTWSSFAECRTAYEAGRHGFAGVGLVIDGSDGLVAVDLDKCVIEGALAPWAAKILTLLGPCYCEMSPSGAGVRALIRGKLPRPGMRADGVELYSAGRYVTITGRPLPGGDA